MTVMNLKLVRLSFGEEIVTEIITETDTEITIKNGLVAIPTQNGGLGFAPWSPIINKNNPEIKISKNYVVYVAEVDDQIKLKYAEIYGGSSIITPPDKQLVW